MSATQPVQSIPEQETLGDYESDDSYEEDETQLTFSSVEEEKNHWKDRYQKKRTKYLELKKFYEEYTKSSEDIEKMFDIELKKAHADVQALKNKLSELGAQKKIVDDENLKMQDKITFSQREIEILKKNDQVLMIQLQKLQEDKDSMEKTLRIESENLRKEKEEREKESLLRIQSQKNFEKEAQLKKAEEELKTLRVDFQTTKEALELSQKENISLKAQMQTMQEMQKQQDELLTKQHADEIEKTKQQGPEQSQNDQKTPEEEFIFKFNNKLNEFKSKFREAILSMD